MIGLSGLIDTLLAAKASPRMEVLAIRREAEIGPPGPVLQVGGVANDVRLPSNAALERRLPGAVGDAAYREGGSAARAARAELSATARLISAVLADAHGDAGPVRGAAPAWASTQPPNAGALAGRLSQSVANSGLFYESHLAAFAAGHRTWAQLAQEPQARWSGPALAAALAAEAEPATTVPTLDEVKPQAAVRHSGVASSDASTVSANVIHPQSVLMVHQQLDLLATSVFCWSGEAWPGVPMQWSIEQEAEDREAPAAAEETPRPWTTTVTMHLPRLGVVDVRLSLADDSVQARLRAAEADTVSRLRSDGGGLARRLDAIGLRLHGFNVAGMERA